MFFQGVLKVTFLFLVVGGWIVGCGSSGCVLRSVSVQGGVVSMVECWSMARWWCSKITSIKSMEAFFCMYWNVVFRSSSRGAGCWMSILNGGGMVCVFMSVCSWAARVS